MDSINILFNLFENPLMYSIIFLIYVILAAVILPIPVEIGLFNPNINPILLILIMGIGKGIGSIIVFKIGLKLRKEIKKRVMGTSLTIKIIKYCEGFVKKYGYIGLFIIMSIPLMIDSVTLYLFSILNPRRKSGKQALLLSRFVVINIAAGVLRGSIILALAYFINIRLV